MGWAVSAKFDNLLGGASTGGRSAPGMSMLLGVVRVEGSLAGASEPLPAPPRLSAGEAPAAAGAPEVRLLALALPMRLSCGTLRAVNG